MKLSFRKVLQIAALGLQLSSMVVLSGCGMASTAEINYISAPIGARIDKNKELLAKIRDAGIITADEYDSVETYLDNKVSQIEETTNNFQNITSNSGAQTDVKNALENDVNLRQILGSVQYFWCPDASAHTTYGIEEDPFIGKIFPLLLKTYKDQLQYDSTAGSKKQMYSTIPGTEESADLQPAAFEILDAEAKQRMNLEDNGKVYVLDFTKLQNVIDGGAGAPIDQLVRYMSDCATAADEFRLGGDDVQITFRGNTVGLSDFEKSIQKTVFSPLLDESGNEVKWFDLSGYEIVKDSVLSSDTSIGGMITDQNGMTVPSDWVDQPGYDVLIQNQIGNEQKPIAFLRVEELNENVVNDMLEAVNGAASDRMMYIGGNFYLFAYPIAYADRFYVDGDQFKIEYKVNDQLLIQFKSLTTLKLDSNNSEHATQSEDAYVCIGQGEYNDFQQFILGPNDLTGNLNLAGTQSYTGTASTNQSNIPVFVMRDYLESVFTPGVLNDGEVEESLVCYGRLIRLNLKGENNASYITSDPIGYYINQDHEKINATGFSDIYVNQLADAQQLKNSVQTGNTIKRLPSNLESVGSSLSGDSQSDSVQKLPVEIVQEIHPVLQFPGDLDAWDKDFSQKPQMYAIALNFDLNQSGLLSHWITSDDDNLSMKWWQNWLNSRNYNYKLTTENVNKWINAEYSISISDREYVIMDMEKIDEQNKIFQEKYNLDIVQQLRTLAMLIGVVCEIYGAVLLLAWAFDANIGLGVGALEKLQFGHWTAIKYKDDGDYYSKNGPMPVTFQDIFIKILIIAAVGAALLAFDISDLIAFLLKLFFGIQSIFENILTGVFGG